MRIGVMIRKWIKGIVKEALIEWEQEVMMITLKM